jgi:hypothetical protein
VGTFHPPDGLAAFLQRLSAKLLSAKGIAIFAVSGAGSGQIIREDGILRKAFKKSIELGEEIISSDVFPILVSTALGVELVLLRKILECVINSSALADIRNVIQVHLRQHAINWSRKSITAKL